MTNVISFPTQEKTYNRNEYIGGSDANRLLYRLDKQDWETVGQQWDALYLEKIGEQDPEDLSENIRVQIGIATEHLNIQWLERELNQEITRNVVVKPDGFMASNLDGVTKNIELVECKHTSERNRMDIVAENYYPQLQHYMMHTDTDMIHLAVIFGNARWESTIITSDPTYQIQLKSVETIFWDCVTEKRLPSNHLDSLFGAKIKAPTNIKLSGMRKVDLSTNTSYKKAVKQYLETKPYVKLHVEAKHDIKELVPNDAYEVTGGGIVIKRSKNNTLTIREEQTDE